MAEELNGLVTKMGGAVQAGFATASKAVVTYSHVVTTRPYSDVKSLINNNVRLA